jgi:hypothetical protein
MKLRFLHPLGATLLTALIFGSVFAAETTNPLPIIQSIGGLQVSLTTGGYKFLVTDDSASPVAGVTDSAPISFPASIVVVNRSAIAIPFVFPDPASAARKFNLSVYDSTGVLVWRSDADVASPQVLVEGKLAARSRWSRLVGVPLKPDGKALAEGIYTLVAEVASVEPGKRFGASAIFEVARPSDPPLESGIDGLVLKANPPEAANPLPSEVPAAGALVSIGELRVNTVVYDHPPFFWSGRADENGRFKVKTPSGRFRITASLPGTTDSNTGTTTPGVSKTVEVSVELGKYTNVTVQLPLPPQPPPESGIKGLVLYGPITPVAVVGEPNEAPAVNAPVVIEEILLAGATRLPFRWSGHTSNEGRFQTRTPAGRFKVTAFLATQDPTSTPGVIIRPPSATVEVSVTAGQYSDVTLHIDTGIR